MIRTTLVRYAILVSTALLVAPAYAAEEENDLYLVAPEVLGKSREQRMAAIRLGMAQVLTRLTGRATFADTHVGRFIVREAPVYVAKWQYQQRGLDVLLPDIPEESEHRPHLRMRFNQEWLSTLLQGKDIPIRSTVPPPVNIWMAWQDQGRARVLSRDGQHDRPMRQALSQVCDLWGLRCRLPLLAELAADEDAIVQNIVRSQTKPLRRRSTDANKRPMLVASLISTDGENWQQNWQIHFAGKQYKWFCEPASSALALNSAAQGLMDVLAFESGELENQWQPNCLR